MPASEPPRRPAPTERALQRLQRQYLTTSGWLQSVEQEAAVDASGAVPWFTYPATRFLARLVQPHWKVLEYGSGNSTRWWAARTAAVVSVEHDPGWAGALRRALPANVQLEERVMDDPVSAACDRILREQWYASGCQGLLTADPTRNYRAGLLDSAYAAYAAVGLDYAPGHFDVVVCDGMARCLTAWIAARQVRPGGLVVFDNADRAEYAPGYAALEAAGFARIDFWGMGPINPYEWCTAVFVRDLAALQAPSTPFSLP